MLEFIIDKFITIVGSGGNGMDIFIEKIVSRRKSSADYLIILGIIAAAFILSVVCFTIFSIIAPLLVTGIIIGAYFLITSKNIEYEYIVTNDELDVDKITNQKKRQRVFSNSCRDFEIVAKVNSEKYVSEYEKIENKLNFTSVLGGEDVYFIVLNYKGARTVVFFEPNERMMNAFKTYIPRKVFE